MLKQNLFLLICILFFKISFSQTSTANYSFPQQEINRALSSGFKNITGNGVQQNNMLPAQQSACSAIKKMQLFQLPQINNLHCGQRSAIDTMLVGDVPGDTLVITGTWNHNGPIWVFNDGVLIFHNAIATNTGGDLIVFQNGRVLADSSSITFPQQYFYERSFIAVQNALMYFDNCSFNFSGMSHNLVLGDSAIVVLNSIHNNDWTTCGLFGKPTLSINGCNLAGEYILSGAAKASFRNTDTLLLWHHFPDSAVVNYSFPAGDTVYNYICNDTVNGISGIGYSVMADSCHYVMWAMMPVNGSDVTISNSVIRAIGCWFQYGDSVSVKGVFDNSMYANYAAPMPDRILNLINSSVQTWSLYVFDSSHISIDSCQVGEVGSQQRSTVASQQFILDGSGGYFWATDTSFIIASGVTVYSTVRSERYGIFVLAYSWLPFTAPSAISNSVMIYVQNNLASDPVAYDAGTAWLQTIVQPDTAFTDTLVSINGSAWIDQGPFGSWMDFGSYSLYYQLQGSGTWLPVVTDSLSEVHNGTLSQWNTHGLVPGVYILRLVVKNNLNDSVEGFKPITLVALPVTVEENDVNNMHMQIIPNPSDGKFMLKFFSKKETEGEIEIINTLGETVFKNHIKINNGLNKFIFKKSYLESGIYFIRLFANEKGNFCKIVINR